MFRASVQVFLVMVVVLVMCCSFSNALSYGMNKQCRTHGLANGLVIPRARGRFVKYRCLGGFKILGDRSATCLRGVWEYQDQMPVCTRPGCSSSFPAPANGQVQTMIGYMGSVMTFSCDPGFTLTGSPAAFCNGYRWNASTPSCTPEKTATTTECDFEDADLCGWSHATDQHFEWTRHAGPTPSNGVHTGPSRDHTMGRAGAGHYMYTESSSPRLQNDTARLVSPVFDAALSVDACLVFYFHMFGLTIGTLNVYVKPEGRTQWPKIFTLSGQQGNKWVRAVARIDPLDENFQVVLEGVRGATYLGDMAVDDVRLANGTDCESEATTTDAATDAGTTIFDADASRSCRERCFELPPPQDTDATVEGQSVCHCDLACAATSACCDDFEDYCLGRIQSKTSPTTAPPTASHRTVATTLYSPPNVTALTPLPSKPSASVTAPPATKPVASSTAMPSSLSSSLASSTSVAAPTSSPSFASSSLTSTSSTSSSQPSEKPTTPSSKPTIPTTPSSKPTIPSIPSSKPTIPTTPSTKPSLPTTPTTNPTIPTTPSTKPPLLTTPTTNPALPPTTSTSSTTNSPTTKTPAKTNAPTTPTVSASSPKSSSSPRTSSTSPSTVTRRTTFSTATTTLASSTTKLPAKTTPVTSKPTAAPSKSTSKTTKVSTGPVTTPSPTARPPTSSSPESSSSFRTSETATPARPITTSKTSVKSNDRHNSVDVKEQIEQETKFLENSQLLKERPERNKVNTWQVAHRVAESRGVSTLALSSALAAGICVLLAAVAAISVWAVRRRRAARTRGHADDESEVRFLTAEEILDFNNAQPKDDDL